MLQRVASLGAGLALLALAVSGCFSQQEDGVFGPANSLGGAENDSPALSLKATPARGPGPLDVEFSLSARDRDGGALSWSLDFGDRTAPATGSELPAKPRHTYTAPGVHLAAFKVVEGSGEGLTFVSTISVVVLESLPPAAMNETAPTQGPEPEPEPAPVYSAPAPPQSSSSSSSSGNSSAPPGNGTSQTGTTTPPANSTSPTSSTTTTTATTTSEPPPPETTSSSSSSSGTGTSSSTDTGTFSDPDPTTSDTGTTTQDPGPTGSETQTSSDPPL